MLKSPLQSYAIAVCYTAIVLLAVSVGMVGFSALRWSTPTLTSDQLIAKKLELQGVENYIVSDAVDAKTRYNDETRLYLQQQIADQEALERFRARRALLLWSIIAVTSGILWGTHWRIMRNALQPNNSLERSRDR